MNKSPGGYLKCIATREGVEMAEDTSRHLPATAEQQKQIKALIKKHPQSKESHEYEYYIANPTRGNADAFLWNICEEYQDGPKRDVYLNAGTKKLVASIVAELARDSRIQKLYSLWYEQKEDVIRTYTNKMPERIPLEQEKEFRAIRNAVVQAALQLQLPQEELPLSDPVPPRVDFVDNGSDVYPKAIESLREPEVEPDSEVKQFLHEAAIHGSVDAVYGVGKQYLKTDIQKAISMFELAAEQGNSYAEYQLGIIYCFGRGVPQNLEAGMEWLKTSASHGNEYATQLLEKVENHIHWRATSAVFGLFRGLAGMIQSSANNFIRRRNSIDRKQRQKIEEKKQALGQRSSGYEYAYNEEQTM